MKRNKGLKAGDILLVKGNSILSKSIMFFMDRYRRKLGLVKRELYSHAAIIIEIYGRLFVAESNGRGVEINTFEDSYAKKMNRVKVLTPNKAYTAAEKTKVSKIAASYVFNPTRYDFFNFIYQIDMIRRTSNTDNKKWLGPKGSKAEKRMYCSEFVATVANKVRPNTFEKPWTVNPLDIDLNRYYKAK